MGDILIWFLKSWALLPEFIELFLHLLVSANAPVIQWAHKSVLTDLVSTNPPPPKISVIINAHPSVSLLGTRSHAEAIRRRPVADSRSGCRWDPERLNGNTCSGQRQTVNLSPSYAMETYGGVEE
jgi:hypothetical protein